MQKTLRQLREAVINALRTENALNLHCVPFDYIQAGSANGIDAFPTPYLLVYAHHQESDEAENSGGMRIAEINIFCMVKPEATDAEAEMKAVELGEKVEKILTSAPGFQWIKEGTPTVDGTYSDYSAAYVIFTHTYISSAL